MTIQFTLNQSDFQAQLVYIRKRLWRRSGMTKYAFFSNMFSFFFLGLGGVFLIESYQHPSGLVYMGYGMLVFGMLSYVCLQAWGNRQGKLI